MRDVRTHIEERFRTLAGVVCRHRLQIVLAAAILIVGMIPGLSQVSLDTSNEGLLHREDPVMQDYYAFRKEFGRGEMIIVAVESPEVFSQTFLKKLKVLHEDLEKSFPQINEITSLINAPLVRGDADSLVVDDLLGCWPQTSSEMAVLKERFLASPFYRNRLVSENGRLAALLLRLDVYSASYPRDTGDEGFKGNLNPPGKGTVLTGFDIPSIGKNSSTRKFHLSDDERNAVIRDIRGFLAKYWAEDFRIYLAGGPVVDETLKRTLLKDIFLFLGLSLLIIGLCLFVMFGRVSGVLLPLLIVTLAVVNTVGAMGYLGVPIKIPTIILPSLLLITSVEDSVFIMVMFYRNLQRKDNKEEAVAKTLSRSGLALVLTSLTTAVGLASFAGADIAPIADLGVFASFGVVMALLYNIVLLPALLGLIPLRWEEENNRRVHFVRFDRMIDRIADFSTRRPKAIVAVTILLISFSLLGAAKLRFSHNLLAWLSEDIPVRSATEKIDRELKGTVAVEVLLDTGRECGLYDPVILRKLDLLAREIKEMKSEELLVGNVTSVADLIKEVHRAMNENRTQFYAVPDDPKIIAQEFLLFESSGSHDLKWVMDSASRSARITITLPWLDTMKYIPFLTEIERRFRNTFETDANITVTGITSLFARTVFTAMHSAAKSYVIALAAITFLMILLIGSPKVGLVSMLPNLAPIFLTLGMMGWFGLRFDLSTMLVFCITLGLVVNHTIHFLHNFQRNLKETGDINESARRTMHALGQPILASSTVLSLGFFTFMLSSMTGLFYFGLLSGLIVFFALLADLIMDPALMVLMYGSVSGKS
jgi:hydrophobe/amphiphile efflux-3 (HAE3) family protein